MNAIGKPELPAMLGPGALDVLMPMHVFVGGGGWIRSTGPTLAKLRPKINLPGHHLFDIVELRRPRNVDSIEGLRRIAGTKLHLRFRDSPHTPLKGVAVRLPDDGGVLIDLSFGIAVVDAVRDYHLTSADFAPTDLTVEMLYLVEAKSAAMEESRGLNRRLEGAKIAAEEQAFTDTLTGLKNRRALDHVLSRLTGSGEDFALMAVDLDYFKEVNDALGHAAGDHVLQEVARILIDVTRADDLIARTGGDEFVLLLRDMPDVEDIDRVAARIIERLHQPIRYQNHPCEISCSLGTAMSSFYALPEARRMQRDADIALYASKHAGRACHTIVTDALLSVAAASTGRVEAWHTTGCVKRQQHGDVR